MNRKPRKPKEPTVKKQPPPYDSVAKSAKPDDPVTVYAVWPPRGEPCHCVDFSPKEAAHDVVGRAHEDFAEGDVVEAEYAIRPIVVKAKEAMSIEAAIDKDSLVAKANQIVIRHCGPSSGGLAKASGRPERYTGTEADLDQPVAVFKLWPAVNEPVATAPASPSIYFADPADLVDYLDRGLLGYLTRFPKGNAPHNVTAVRIRSEIMSARQAEALLRVNRKR
jgi:hypothetical protein